MTPTCPNCGSFTVPDFGCVICGNNEKKVDNGNQAPLLPLRKFKHQKAIVGFLAEAKKSHKRRSRKSAIRDTKNKK